MSPSRLWLVLGVVYAFFFYWYTSFGGPLTSDEIEHYAGLMQARAESREDGPPREFLAQLRKFLEDDSGDDFVMVNVIEFRDPPGQVEGTPPAADAEEQLARYMEFMWPALLSRACHPVLFGWAAGPTMDLMGFDGVEDMETWSQAGMMRYRSRRDLMEIATNPEFAGRHNFQDRRNRQDDRLPDRPVVPLRRSAIAAGLALPRRRPRPASAGAALVLLPGDPLRGFVPSC